MTRLGKEKVLALRKQFAKRYGCEELPRDEKALEAVLAGVFPAGGKEGPDDETRAARLAYELVTKRVFRTGNAAFGMFMLMLWLEACGCSPSAEPEEVTAVGLALRSGRLSCADLLQWVRQHVN